MTSIEKKWRQAPGRRPRQLLIAAFLGLFTVSVSVMAQADRPNVLIVYVDDLGYGDLAAFGHPVVHTPNIDRLAAEGMRFTQFYAPSALCSPSRAGLLTGRTPYRTGVRDWIPDDSPVSLGVNEHTIADLAKARGYRTAVIGKWHLNGGLHMEAAPQPRDFGFDYQYGLDAWVKNESVAGIAGHSRRGRLYPDNFYRNNQPVGSTRKYSAELVSDDALRWLEADDAADSQPFLLLLTYSEVHTPIASPDRWLRHYDAFLTDEARENPFLYYFDWRNRPWRGRGEYYANISFLDEQLGRVLDHLRERGKLDDTLVIFSSDNGPVTAAALTPWELGMAGETAGLRGKKRFLFEGGIRVPGIVRYPSRVPAGSTESTPVTALDVYPTLMEILKTAPERSVPLDGQSLLPLFAGESLERDQPLLWAIKTPDGVEYVLRDGDWKLIADSGGAPIHLFNLAQDYYEVDNRLERESARVVELAAQLAAHREAIERDPLLVERAAYQATP